MDKRLKPPFAKPPFGLSQKTGVSGESNGPSGPGPFGPWAPGCPGSVQKDSCSCSGCSQGDLQFFGGTPSLGLPGFTLSLLKISSSLMGSLAKGFFWKVCGKFCEKFAEIYKKNASFASGNENSAESCGNFAEICRNFSAMTLSRTTP